MRRAFSRTPWPWLFGALVGAAGTAGVACSAILGLEPPPSQDGGAGTGGSGGGDAGGPAPVCAALDASLGPDATVEAGVYSPLSPVTGSDAGGNWDFLDLGTLTPPVNPNFLGGTFDDRYVYFAPRGATALRYDTQAGDFFLPSSWQQFDISKLPAVGTGGFSGAVYNGGYVYFVPYQGGTPSTPASVVARYDTSGPFTAASSWSTFDLTTMNVARPDAGSGFYGGALVGHDVFLVPHNNGVPDGRVVRYAAPDAGPLLDAGQDAGEDAGGDAGKPTDAGVDAGEDAGQDAGGDAGKPTDAGVDAGDAGDQGFDDAGPWTTFDLGNLNQEAVGFAGAVFDGTSLYLVPQNNGAFGNAVHSGNSGVVARYRTTSAFQVATSWSFFDTTTVNGDAYAFTGASFDGRYVYLVPRSNGVVVRYDTSAASSFNASLSPWSWYDVTRAVQLDASVVQFAGSAFDGRFVYFIPTNGAFGQIVRYDTLSTFTADCAWSTADIGAVSPGKGTPGVYQGAVFDGQYLYLVPSSGTYLVARFLVRTPGSMPALPSFHGSFW